MKEIIKARAALVLDQIFFGSLALRLRIEEDNAQPTACVDGKTMRYNADFIRKLTSDERKGVMCHEVLHCANGHHARRGDRDAKLWNIACDLAINPLVRGAGMTLPAGALDDARFADMNAEAIYSKLMQEGGTKAAQQKYGAGSGCGEVTDAPGGDDNSNNPSDGDNAQAASPAQLAQAEEEWKVAVSQAASAAKMQGKLPSVLERYVADALEPRADWRTILREFLSCSAENDYVQVPFNRRYIGQEMYLPSMHSDQLDPICVAIDTSGSIGERELAAFAAELNAIACELPISRVDVMYCDAKLHKTDTYTQDDLPIELKPVGGGGTDFRPVFAALAKADEPYSACVYFTDMEGSFPSDVPEARTLWVDFSGRTHEAPFGEVVPICV